MPFEINVCFFLKVYSLIISKMSERERERGVSENQEISNAGSFLVSYCFGPGFGKKCI